MKKILLAMVVVMMQAQGMHKVLGKNSFWIGLFGGQTNVEGFYDAKQDGDFDSVNFAIDLSVKSALSSLLATPMLKHYCNSPYGVRFTKSMGVMSLCYVLGYGSQKSINYINKKLSK